MKKCHWFLGVLFLGMSSQSFAMPQDGCYNIGENRLFSICLMGLYTKTNGQPLLKIVRVIHDVRDQSGRVLECLSSRKYSFGSYDQSITDLVIYVNEPRQFLMFLKGKKQPGGVEKGILGGASKEGASNIQYVYLTGHPYEQYFSQCPDPT